MSDGGAFSKADTNVGDVVMGDWAFDRVLSRFATPGLRATELMADVEPMCGTSECHIGLGDSCMRDRSETITLDGRGSDYSLGGTTQANLVPISHIVI